MFPFTKEILSVDNAGEVHGAIILKAENLWQTKEAEGSFQRKLLSLRLKQLLLDHLGIFNEKLLLLS